MKLTNVFLWAAWIVFLGFVGPWLISAASTIAVLIGIAIAVALLILTINRANPPIAKRKRRK